jgi:ureidoacrylate peracid hydrolase
MILSAMQNPVSRLSRRGFMAAGAVTSAVGGVASTTGKAAQRATPTERAATTGRRKSRLIKVDAKPEPIEIDIAETALIVVDMQNDFAAKGGLVDRLGFDIAPIRKTIGPMATVLASARAVGITIIYLKMGFRPDLSDLGSPDSPNRIGHLHAGVGKTVRAPNGAESRILVRDTWNTDIVPELKPHDQDLVLYKTRYSGFYQTELDATLKRHAVKHLVVIGCTTSICVESTVRDAMFRDYRCVLLSDCMAEVIGNDLARSNHEASLLLIQMRFGWVTGSEEFIRTLKT